MAVTCEDFVIDIAHKQSFRYLQAKQYDHNSRKRRLIITDSNQPIPYKGTEYIVFSMYLNGENYSNTSCPFEADGYPYLTFTESMLSRAGDVDCEIRIYDNRDQDHDTVITTFTFRITISKTLLNHDRLVKSSEVEFLNNLILQALGIPDLVQESQANLAQIHSMIVQVNQDITSYQTEYSALSAEAKELITDVSDFLTTAQAGETVRMENETARIEAERLRQLAETNRISQAESFAAAEAVRVRQEQERQTDTAAAVSNAETATQAALEQTAAMTNLEETWTQNEALRQANEGERIANEDLREDLHGAMQELEAAASSNETLRQQQEAKRQANTSAAISNAEEATAAAWDAVQNVQHAIGIDDLTESFTSTWSSKQIASKAQEWALRKSIRNITIPADLWVNNMVYLRSESINEDSVIDIYYDPESLDLAAECDLRYTQGNGYLCIKAVYSPYQPITIETILIENYRSPVEGALSPTREEE
ncbi:MAG: hypothetical protein HFE84_06000 [Lachnospiraceae bacterium]|nr:hypothetical protein [Lachnospiraceae bacterium]